MRARLPPSVGPPIIRTRCPAFPEKGALSRMVDLMIVGGYLTFMLGVGGRARKATADAYWVADRRYGRLPVAASLVATIFGASSTVGIVGLGYARGLTGASSESGSPAMAKIRSTSSTGIPLRSASS